MTLERTDRDRKAWHGWLWNAASCVLLVSASYLLLDRLIAGFVHKRFHDAAIFVWATHIVDPFLVIAAIALVASAVVVIGRWQMSRAGDVLLRSSLSLAAVIIVKDQLKFVFGRTWPETWIENNPSFFRDGVYGFYPFHGGAGYSAFPSGHMAEICAVMAALWILYPPLRWLYVMLALAVAVGLIGADYHWLSDVIAGSYLGIAVGIVGARIGALQSMKSREP